MLSQHIGLGVTNLLTLLVLPQTRYGLVVMFTPVQRVSYSIIGSRIVLNLRGALEPLNLTGRSVRNVTKLEFARGEETAVTEPGVVPQVA